MIAPDGGVGMGTMTGGLFGDGQKDISSFLYFFYGGLHDVHFGRVAFIVGGIDGIEDAFYLSQVWFGVVLPGGVEGIDHVVGVLVTDEIFRGIVIGSFCLFA